MLGLGYSECSGFPGWSTRFDMYHQFIESSLLRSSSFLFETMFGHGHELQGYRGSGEDVLEEDLGFLFPQATQLVKC